MPSGDRRHLFEIPDDVAYLNCAGQAPQLRAVRAAGERALSRRAEPWTVRPEDWFAEVERLRGLFASLTRADADGVALIPATSYGLAVAALNAEPGGRVLLLADEFASNVNTWLAWAERGGGEVIAVGRPPGRSWTDAVVGAIDERVGVVSVPTVRWTDGAVVDLARVGARAREVDALFVVDATQSLGAVPLDIAALDPDYLVAAGYKWLLGPLSAGYMYVAERHRSGRPIEENWANRDGGEYRPGARRFDVGQRSNFVLTPMAISALAQLHEWGIVNVAAGLAPVTDRIEYEARVRGLDPTPAAARGPHMLAVALPPDRAKAIGEQLAAANVFVEILGSAMRVSPHLHASDEDVDRLFAALDGALR
jgi:selenocysteine lyase/cysteine desulfurase